jgi:hypothetical protein
LPRVFVSNRCTTMRAQRLEDRLMPKSCFGELVQEVYVVGRILACRDSPTDQSTVAVSKAAATCLRQLCTSELCRDAKKQLSRILDRLHRQQQMAALWRLFHFFIRSRWTQGFPASHNHKCCDFSRLLIVIGLKYLLCNKCTTS